MLSQVSTVTSLEAPRVVVRGTSAISRPRSLDEVASVLSTVIHAMSREVRVELYVLEAHGVLRPTIHVGAEASASREVLAAIRGRLAVTGRLLTEPQALEPDELPGRRAIMTAPLRNSAGRLNGLVIVERDHRAGGASRQDLIALEGVAALVGLALERLDLSGTDAQATRKALDRTSAGLVQRGFMRSTLPAGIGVTARAGYVPAFDVGGDFYDVRRLPDGTVSVAIGDVAGNGVSAALVMSRVTSELERALEAGAAPGGVLAALNARLAGAAADMFVTASCAHIDPARRRVTLANAGHLPAILRRANGEVFTFGGATGMPLGMFDSAYDEDECLLESGDILLLVTDGVLEALDHPSGHMGMEILLDEVRSAPHDLEAVHERIRDSVDDLRVQHALDDVTWVSLQVDA
jgi:serine phosphatase RsbU (regulator of sigma subunit)